MLVIGSQLNLLQANQLFEETLNTIPQGLLLINNTDKQIIYSNVNFNL